MLDDARAHGADGEKGSQDLASMVRLCLAGEGAQGFSHYATLSAMAEAEVVTLCGGVAADTEQFAKVRRPSHRPSHMHS